MPGRRRESDRSPGTFRRDEALARLGSEHFDVLVVGGGITGAGVALDAAARGLRTALVERHDFASGTSSKSSKMVHGGLRYLQQRDFRLVYEALHERQRLLENAPHLVTPLPFLIPLFGRDGVVNKTVNRLFSTALWAYDFTGGYRIGKLHRRISKEAALEHLPTLRADRLVEALLYYDARADDARLTLTIARTAAAHGAAVANYAEVTEFRHGADGKVNGAVVRPAVLAVGTTAAIEVSARVVVNATGVWADEVRAVDEGVHPRSIRPAKGIHVTVPRAKLPADVAATIPVPKDHRMIFVVPWPDGDDVYLGTTDTDWDGDLDDPVCTPEDVDYVLGAANGVVTEQLERGDVTGVWAGLRPLLAPGSGPVSERTADLSRRHTVRVSPHGVVTVTGGKLTTYRRMAEDTVDEVVRRLGAGVPSSARHCPTRRLKLLGAPQRGGHRGEAPPAPYGRREGDAKALDQRALDDLARRHGTETGKVLELAEGRPELLEPLVEGLPYLAVEAVWAVREEMALTVDDVLSRRTRARLRRAEASAEAAASVGALLAAEWGRSPEEVAIDARAYATAARRDLDRAGVGGAEVRSGTEP